MKKIIYLLLPLLLFSSCSENISTETVVANTKIKTRIQITDNPDTKELDDVSVFLYDKEGKTIAGRNIKISINDTPLHLTGGYRQRYYHTKSKFQYYTDSIPTSKYYVINMVMEDSTNFELASYIPINKNKVKLNFITNNKKDYDELNWCVLEDINRMSYKITRSQKNIKTNTFSDSVIQATVKNKGMYKINKSFFKSDSIFKINNKWISFKISKNGLLNSKLLPDSSISGSSSFLVSIN